MCKRGGVSSGVIAISATLTSQLPPCTFRLPEFINPENWPANSQYLNPAEFSVWVSLQRTLILSLEVLRRWLSKVRSVELLGSGKSGHSKRTDRSTAKNTDRGD